MNKLILVITMTLGFRDAIPHPGVGIVMDSKGNVYYTDLTQIWKIDLDGKKSIVVSHVHSHEIYIDVADNLFGEHLWYNGETTNTWGHYVWKLSSDEKVTKVIPETNGFLTNYSFVRDLEGTMYWANRDGVCQKVDAKKFNGQITSLSKGCFSKIHWMTATSDGVVYVLDKDDVKKIDRLGNITTLAKDLSKKTSGNEPGYLSGINTDKANNVYLADHDGHQVKKITPSGAVSVAVETGNTWSPSGTLVAPNGDFWILETSATNAVRVERITTLGRRIIY